MATENNCRCGQPIEKEYRGECNSCHDKMEALVKTSQERAEKFIIEAEAKYSIKFSPSQKHRMGSVMARIATNYLRAASEIKTLEVGVLSENQPNARSLRFYCTTDFIGKDTVFKEYFHGYIGTRGALTMHRSSFGVSKDYSGREACWF